MAEGQQFSRMYDALCSKLRTQCDVSIITHKFANLTSDEERMAFVLNQSEVHELICPRVDDSGKKISTLSKQLREKGNKFFQARDYKTSLVYYSKSILYAPNAKDDNCLSLAFANHSAALFHMNEYESCIKDIELALDNSYPDAKKYKLSERKARCYSALGDIEKAQACFDLALKEMAVVKMDKKTRHGLENSYASCLDICCKNLNAEKKTEQKKYEERPIAPSFEESPNAVFTSLSTAADVVYAPGRGRYIVAKQYIPPGNIILIEKPYASVLLNKCVDSHCHHCYKPMLICMPCPNCAHAAFCSETCRSHSMDTYHRFECKCLSALYNAGLDKFAHLSLRTLAKQPLLSVLKHKENGTYEESDRLKGCTDGRYMPDDYHAIKSLVTHASDRSPQDLYCRTVLAFYLLKCLQLAGYFSDLSLASIENQAFIGGLLLSHLQLLPCNAHEVSELLLDPKNVSESTTQEIGAGIYATLSLFNHSCNPAVTRNFYGDTCVVRTIRAVHPREELADNYGAVYEVMDKGQRQEILSSQYFFTCQCEACLDDWPTFDKLQALPTRWRCLECLIPWAEHSNECSKQIDKDYDKAKLQSNLEQVEQEFGVAFEDVMSCNWHRALPILLKYLEVMDTLVPPYKGFSSCQEAIKQCFNLMSNCKTVK